ncbi:MAG: phosphodiesterase [Ruminococcaceae bacterium]|nr:phosphodiesterase [Oscillospiraceae bacterium]
MKWLIASDIHGSAFYAQKLVEAIEREGAERVLLLGDLLYHGPRNDLPKDYQPKKVIDLLNAKKEKLLCVRGNCDTEVDQMVLEFPILSDYALICEEGVRIYASHGHKFSPQSLPPLVKGDVFLYGHTHIPAYETVGGCVCINPGSVSIPKEDSHHGYMIFENGCFFWKTLEGEIVREESVKTD